ncbi:MAG: MASE1 domain-containing protein, partial [Gemmatimonadetes bacterium]|nr:MASE1 domain-containing protein [Gemmatimonadota bacterium]
SEERPGVAWLPDGISFALLWLAPSSWRLPIAGVVFAGTLALFAQHYPMPIVALLTSIPVARNVLMVIILKHFHGDRPLLGSWAGVARLMVASVLTAALMAPAMSLPDFLAGNQPFQSMALTTGTFALGTLGTAPALLMAELGSATPPLRVRLVDVGLGLAFLLATGALLLGLIDLPSLQPARFLAVVPFLWLVWRFRVRGAAIGIAVLATVAATSATAGLGQFGPPLELQLDRAFVAQLFIATFAVSGLGLGALLDEQAARTETPASLRNLLEQSAEGVIIRSVEGKILYLNPAAERVLEAEGPESIVGQPWHRFLTSETRATAVGPEAEIGSNVLDEYELVSIKGNRRRLHAIETALRDHSDRPFAILTTVRGADRNTPPRGLAQAESRLRALAMSIETAREAERNRISRELHDELGQALVGMALDLRWLRNNTAKPDVQLRLEGMQRTLDYTAREVRRLTSELRPAMLDDLGLAEAIEWQAKVVAERAGLQLELDLPAEVPIDRDRAIAVFRIAQEALTNVARHAGARRVAVELSWEPSRLELTIRDDGIGLG